MAKQRHVVAERDKVRKEIDVISNRRKRGNLFGEIKVRAGLLRHEHLRRAAETPEPGAKAHRHRRTRRKRRAVAVQKNIQKRQSNRHRAAVQHAAKDATSI